MYPSTFEIVYPRNLVPRIFEAMYPVPQIRNHVPYTFKTIYFHKKIEKKEYYPNDV